MAKKSLILKAARPAKFRTRRYARCKVCGRSGGFLRRFQVCRICFREMASRGLIPGVSKASW